MIIEGYASIYNIKDQNNDMIMQNAFSIDVHPKMLWQHIHSEVIGQWLTIYNDSYGLFAKGKIFAEIQKGKEAILLIENRLIDGLSIGFVSNKSINCTFTNTRKIFQAHLYEISIVSFPANINTKINKFYKE